MTDQPQLPLYGDPRPMSEAPRDFTNILVKIGYNGDKTSPWFEVVCADPNGAWLRNKPPTWVPLGWWPLPGATP